METNGDKRSFLFNVDIMIEAETSGVALEQLLRHMNEAKIMKDYQIKSGIILGQQIKQALAQSPGTEPVPELKKQLSKGAAGQEAATTAPGGAAKGKSTDLPQEPNAKATAKSPPTEAKIEPVDMFKRIHEFIAKNTLIRLTILKGKGIKLSIPCRIVAYDSVLQTVTVYHVDEKKVYQFRLNEIDEFIVS